MDGSEDGGQESECSRLDSVSFDQLIEDQNPFLNGTPRLDLRKIQWVSPSGLVQLAAVGHALAAQGKRLHIQLGNGSVVGYMVRAGFTSVMQAVATIEPEWCGEQSIDHLRGTNSLLLEVTKVDKVSALPELLSQIVVVLRRRLRYHKHEAFDIVTAISEITQNTFEHNKNATCFVAMQVYGRGRKRFVEIGVADCGEGIAATLRRNQKNPNVVSDRQAIQLSTCRGISEHDDPTHGTGLYHLLEIAYRHRGSVQIRSGRAKVRYRMDKKQGWSFNVINVPGVQIALSLPTKAAA